MFVAAALNRLGKIDNEFCKGVKDNCPYIKYYDINKQENIFKRFGNSLQDLTWRQSTNYEY